MKTDIDGPKSNIFPKTRDEIVVNLNERWMPWIRGGLVRKGVSKSDLDDACQDVLLRMMQKAHKLRDPRCAPAYAMNVAGTVAGRHKRRPVAEVLEDAYYLRASETIIEPALYKAVAKLRPAYKRAILRVYWLGESYREAACVTRSSERTIKRNVQNALKELRTVFMPQIGISLGFQCNATAKRFPLERLPQGLYRISLGLRNPSDIEISAQTTVEGFTPKPITLLTCFAGNSTIEHYLDKPFEAIAGKHHFAVAVNLTGFGFPQRHLFSCDVC